MNINLATQISTIKGKTAPYLQAKKKKEKCFKNNNVNYSKTKYCTLIKHQTIMSITPRQSTVL